MSFDGAFFAGQIFSIIPAFPSLNRRVPEIGLFKPLRNGGVCHFVSSEARTEGEIACPPALLYLNPL